MFLVLANELQLCVSTKGKNAIGSYEPELPSQFETSLLCFSIQKEVGLKKIIC